jgi:hypothetical protein
MEAPARKTCFNVINECEIKLEVFKLYINIIY